MKGLHIVLCLILGVVCCSHGWISVQTLEMTARPGDDITLYCDCKGSYKLVWFRNCSHENQPTLVLSQFTADRSFVKHPGFEFVRNFSSNSYDLLIANVTDSHEGLYYCGTEELKVEDDKFLTSSNYYRYGNITTRLIVKPDTSGPHYDTKKPLQECGLCWRLLFCLCPAVAVLSALLSALVVHRFCQKSVAAGTIPQGHETRYDNQHHTEQDENVCYAALEIRQTSQRPNKKKTQSSDSDIYSAPSMS